jgi:fatty acid desaturase
MLSDQEVRQFSRVSSWHTVLSLAVDWALIVVAFALAMLVPHPIVWAFSFLLIARQQLALAIMMHDAAHKRLFNVVGLNDYVGQFVCAGPLLFSMYSYRTLHLKHHQAPLAADDPDISLIGGYPISKTSFIRKLVRDATGVSYFKFIRYFIHMARKPRTGSGERHDKLMKRSRESVPVNTVIFSIVLMNTLMAAALALLHHPWFYLSLWLLPAVTALQVLLRIRGVAEHAGYQYSKNQMMSARTVRSSWQTLIFAPHNVNFHIEHHVFPSIPYYNLPKVHEVMTDRRILPQANVYDGYDRVIRELVT